MSQPQGTEAQQRSTYGAEEASMRAITAQAGFIPLILGLACVTMATWADDAGKTQDQSDKPRLRSHGTHARLLGAVCRVLLDFGTL